MLDSSPFNGDIRILDRMLQRVDARALTRSSDSRRTTGRENDAIPDSHGILPMRIGDAMEFGGISG